jgi:hypothetical protein
MMGLKHGKVATALEGQHEFKVGSVLKFVGMDYEYEEEAFIFKGENGKIQDLFKGEFEWVEKSA